MCHPPDQYQEEQEPVSLTEIYVVLNYDIKREENGHHQHILNKVLQYDFFQFLNRVVLCLKGDIFGSSQSYLIVLKVVLAKK